MSRVMPVGRYVIKIVIGDGASSYVVVLKPRQSRFEWLLIGTVDDQVRDIAEGVGWEVLIRLGQLFQKMGDDLTRMVLFLNSSC